jgi:cell division protein FtsZ
MGDEVKITVIATGFRQEQPERRERVLNSILNVHVPPVTFVRADSNGAAPRFAGEMRDEATQGIFHRTEQPPPIVYPVSHARSEEAVASESPAEVEYAPEFDEDNLLEFEPVPVEQPVLVAAGPDQRAFSEAPGFHVEEGSGEDLDVPAFLRRGGL